MQSTSFYIITGELRQNSSENHISGRYWQKLNQRWRQAGPGEVWTWAPWLLLLQSPRAREAVSTPCAQGCLEQGQLEGNYSLLSVAAKWTLWKYVQTPVPLILAFAYLNWERHRQAKAQGPEAICNIHFILSSVKPREDFFSQNSSSLNINFLDVERSDLIFGFCDTVPFRAKLWSVARMFDGRSPSLMSAIDSGGHEEWAPALCTFSATGRKGPRPLHVTISSKLSRIPPAFIEHPLPAPGPIRCKRKSQVHPFHGTKLGAFHLLIFWWGWNPVLKVHSTFPWLSGSHGGAGGLKREKRTCGRWGHCEEPAHTVSVGQCGRFPASISISSLQLAFWGKS